MSAPCSAQRRPAPPSALRRADPTRPLCVRVLDSTGADNLRLAALGNQRVAPNRAASRAVDGVARAV